MKLLDDNIVTQLKTYFNQISNQIELIAFLDESDKSKELNDFLTEVHAISDKVKYVSHKFHEDTSLEEKFTITRPTSFTITKDGEKTGINFCGIPGGHEFNSLILAILGVAGLGKKLDEDAVNKIKDIKEDKNIETFISLSCTHCPVVIQALNQISLVNEHITTSMIDSAVFFEEAKEKDIQAVPVVFINGKMSAVGEKTLDELIEIIAK